MASNKFEKIGFEHEGIGTTIARENLTVPLNQREYSWERAHVLALLQDVNGARTEGKPSYFLGSIVLSRTEDGQLEVVDGQQRLATTMIFLAAVRDYLCQHGQRSRADTIRQTYLMTTDLATEENIPRLRLNVDDNDFFVAAILSDLDSVGRKKQPSRDSHRRLLEAFVEAKEYVNGIVTPLAEKQRADALVAWVEFFKTSVQIVRMTVPDHLDAFIMFETLNDRGLRASQADILKNHLLRMAGAKIKEAQQKWAKMIATLESLDVDDLTVTYLRHAVICRHGPTRERALFQKVRDTVTNGTRAITFLNQIAEEAVIYSAIFNPEHTFWNQHKGEVRNAVRTLLELRMEQIRPLVFAAMLKFESKELERALRLFVSWSVRFLIAGGGRGGSIERAYGEAAEKVFSGSLKTSKDLVKAMDNHVPSDTVFEAAFSEARVSQAYLARYYLRAMELKVKDQPDPEYIPNSEKEAINLEHIIPDNPSDEWKIDSQIVEAYHKRLGNMVLLQAKKNVAIGNKTPAIKLKEFANSGFVLTREVSTKSTWGPNDVVERQKRLAALAITTWSLLP